MNTAVAKTTDDAIGIWALKAVLVLLPLAWAPLVLQNPYGMPKLIVLRFFTAMALLGWLTTRLRKGELRLHGSPIDAPLVLYVFALLSSTIFSINKPTSLFGYGETFEGLITLLNYIILFYLFANIIETKSQLENVLFWGLLAAGIVSAYGVLQKFGYDFFTWGGAIERERSFSTLGTPFHLGGYLVLLLPPGVCALLGGVFRGAKGRAVAIVIGMMTLALFFTYTRASWLGFAVSMAIVAVIGRRDILPSPRLRRSIAIGLAAAALTVALLALTAYSPYAYLRERILAENPILVRYSIWRGALPLIANNPLVGTGPSSFGLVSVVDDTAHNIFVQTAVDLGIPGLLAFVFLIIAFSWRSLAALAKTEDVEARMLILGALGGVVAYIVHLGFSFTYAGYPALWWLLLAAGSRVVAAVNRAPSGRVAFRMPRRLEQPAIAAILLLPLVLYGYLLASAFSAERAFSEGISYQNAQSWAAASERLSRAAALDPRNERYQLALGQAKLVEAQLTDQPDLLVDSINALERARQIDPYEERTYVALVTAHALFGERQQAKFVFQELLRVDPRSFDASANYFMISSQLKMLGLTEEARRAEAKSRQLEAQREGFR